MPIEPPPLPGNAHPRALFVAVPALVLQLCIPLVPFRPGEHVQMKLRDCLQAMFLAAAAVTVEARVRL